MRRHALVFDYALVIGPADAPGPDDRARQTARLALALEAAFDVDTLTIKGADVPHIERFGKGRMLRVPCAQSDPRAAAEAFARAVRRQVEGDDYAVVIARAAWAAAGLPPAEPVGPGFVLIGEADDRLPPHPTLAPLITEALAGCTKVVATADLDGVVAQLVRADGDGRPDDRPDEGN